MISSALITGASGFVGSALATRLASAGVATTALLREGGGGLPAGEATIEPLRVRAFEERDLDKALAGRRFDAVFHLASYGVRPSERDPRKMVRGNVALTLELLLATRACQPRLFVHTGTWSEYGPLCAPERLTESSPIAPTSPYAAAKAAAGMVAAAAAADAGMLLVTLRLFHVYGPGEPSHRLIPYLTGCLHRGEEPELTDGEQVRDFVHVDDVADAFIAVAKNDEIGAGAYNVCTGEPVRVRDVAIAVGSILSAPADRLGLGQRPQRGGEPPWAVGDPSKLRTATGWAPRVALSSGVEAAVRHELRAPSIEGR